MKREYVTPVLIGERFAANEYVAACYKLACTVGPGQANASNGDYWEENEYGGVTHSSAGTPNTCADANANRVITDSGDAFQSVGEYNGEQGWIDGGLDTIIDNGDGKVGVGDVIYWHTYGKNKWGWIDRRWNHVGTLELADSRHPNHS
ncbi:MAG: hypothetical protein SOU03_12545 [Dorea sp.]|nr:hypothetical protein [Dorea sp.]